jgi:hypothetical protein
MVFGVAIWPLIGSNQPKLTLFENWLLMIFAEIFPTKWTVFGIRNVLHD